MLIDAGERRARMSVREFAEFRTGPGPRGQRGAPWRAALGTAWHETLRGREEEASTAARFEVSVQATLTLEGWRIELQGRIDQVIDDGGLLRLREVKTISRTLPTAPEELLGHYREYACQSALYQLLYPIAHPDETRSCASELLFVDIGEGLTQTVDVSALAESLVREQFARLRPFLENRRAARTQWAEATVHPPFAELRPGQAEARAELQTTGESAQAVLLEAPTGFGKTGLLLEYALSHLLSGRFERILYLTGKSTGQLEVVRQLGRMIGGEGGPRVFQMRGKAEHAAGCPLPFCEPAGACGTSDQAREQDFPAHIPSLLAAPDNVLATVWEAAEALRMCPYELSRATLPYADIWVGDYNYVFSPHNRSVFFEQPGFSASRTLLLVDEAHNLAGRVQDAFSGSASAQGADALAHGLRFAGAPPDLLSLAGQWLDLLESLPRKNRLDPTDEYEIDDLVEALTNTLTRARFDFDLLPPEARHETGNLYALRMATQAETLQKLYWAPEKGTLAVTCLDAAPEIEATLRQFGQAVLMSATIAPDNLFREATGLSGEGVDFVRAEAPWRKNACSVAIDTRVDTRLRSRQQHYGRTAETLVALRNASPTPVVAFFPSYDYAETIAAYLTAAELPPRIAMQERGMGLAGQREFIEEALLTADILCLVLGSGFAEGIDLLGGAVETAMVVGPALPEVNPVQQARMDALAHLGREEAFRRVYLVPALRKINQALGRLVRAPGQRARVLLHCRRFAEPATHALLDPEYQTEATLRRDEDLFAWL